VVAAFRRAAYAVVGTSRSIPPSDDPGFVTVRGDIAEPETAERVVDQALERFGRIDSLIISAGIFVGKPFTEYTLDDYAAVTAVNLAGFFHITQRAIAQMVEQGSGHVVNLTTSLVDHANSTSPSALASLTKGGLAAVTRSLATEYASRGLRVNAVALGVIRTPCTTRPPTPEWPASTPSDGSGRSATSSTGSSSSSRPRSSQARPCTSTAVRPLDTEPRRRIATHRRRCGDATNQLRLPRGNRLAYPRGLESPRHD
jgi:NAD(P)-dependent dehydrogenase (short-subunit alcohol dehydrogenase family)